MKTWMKILLGVAIVAVTGFVTWIAYICYPRDARSASPTESSTGHIVGWLFIIAVLSFFGYQIWKKVPKGKFGNLKTQMPTFSGIPKEWANGIAYVIVAIIVAVVVWHCWDTRKTDVVQQAPVTTTTNSQPSVPYTETKCQMVPGQYFVFTKEAGKTYKFYSPKAVRVISYNPVGNEDEYVSVTATSNDPIVKAGKESQALGKYQALIDTTSDVVLRIYDNAH